MPNDSHDQFQTEPLFPFPLLFSGLYPAESMLFQPIPSVPAVMEISLLFSPEESPLVLKQSVVYQVLSSISAHSH